MLKYSDVFVPGGFPRHTYNPRDARKIEEQLAEVKENLCKLVTVTGHTKSGKTVLTRRILPTPEAVWVDGGAVSAEDDLWTSILEQLDAYTDHDAGDEQGSTSTISGKAKAGANYIIAKGEGELGVEHERAKSSNTGRSRKVSNRVAALAVEFQQVVHGRYAAHGRLVVDGRVWSMPVVAVDEGLQSGFPLG